MKKSLVSALTTAIVVGATATSFAAANPFEDVPADHWAYDAVAQLAADGVVEGYGDGTYRGDQEITRYEMAQMVARAMAKGATGADKALIDKLAAEFADELNNLGVRVAALEKKVDNVKWGGEIRYTFARRNIEHRDDNPSKHQNFAQLRLKPSMQINEHWTGRAGIYYGKDKNNLDNAKNENDVQLKWAFADGKYGNTLIQVGRLDSWINHPTMMDEGMIIDDYISGARVTFGKDLKFSITAGRFNFENGWFGDIPSNYQAGELAYSKGKFAAGLAYHHVQTDKLKTQSMDGKLYDKDAMNIWNASIGYRFNDDWRIFGSYAKNTSGDVANKHRTAYNIEIDFKGSKKSKPGSFGIQAGYRQLGAFATLVPTYDYSDQNTRGWFIGGDVMLAKNVDLLLGYFDGKQLSTGSDKYKILFSRIKFFF